MSKLKYKLEKIAEFPPLVQQDQVVESNQPQEQPLMSLNDVLYKTMCSLDVFYRQIKFYHWIIKGQNYIATHRFLDEVAQMISGKIDLFAERLVYLKFTPEYEPTIVESKSEVKYVVSPLATTNEIIDNLLKQFDIVLSNLKESANKSIYDYGTQQFVTEVIYDVEVFKHHIESFKE